MTPQLWVTIGVAIIGSGALSTLISKVFEICKEHSNRKHNKKDKIDILSEKVDTLLNKDEHQELAITRIELMMLIKDYPDHWCDINALAEKYFTKLHGNSYMMGLFSSWLKSRNMSNPVWFEEVIQRERDR